jgi:hypothetical protein
MLDRPTQLANTLRSLQAQKISTVLDRGSESSIDAIIEILEIEGRDEGDCGGMTVGELISKYL